jgi:uncharacterized protein YecT (DUF1311 family)
MIAGAKFVMLNVRVRVFAAFLFLLPVFIGSIAYANVVVVGPNDNGYGVVFVDGEVDFALAREFVQKTKSLRHAVVILQSPGGSVDAGLEIAIQIAENGYGTAVLGKSCSSICAVIWLAGNNRYMTEDASIGVHAAYRIETDQEGNPIATESGSANAEIGAFLALRGLSRDAIRYVTMASPEHLAPITSSIAQLLEIDVFVANKSDILSPDSRGSPMRVVRLVGDLEGLKGVCYGILEPNTRILEQQLREILGAAEIEYGAEILSQRATNYSRIIVKEISNQGTVRWCISATSRVQEEGLETGIVGPSFDCSRAQADAEYAICSSQELWAFDRAMASLYFFYKRDAGTRLADSFLQSQRAWLRERNSCAFDERCLKNSYMDRLADFGH